MKVIFRSTDQFLQHIKHDLARSHPFAAERVGFITVCAASTPGALILLPQQYHPVADTDYIDDPRVGAMINHEALRKALNLALLQRVGVFHVHLHEHAGRPRFSPVDLREQLKFVPDFFKVCDQFPHGAIVLSRDCAAGRAWLAPNAILNISEFNTVGPATRIDIAEADFGQEASR